MLLNFQTMVAELVHMDICNSSLLDEATAAAEAVTMANTIASRKKNQESVVWMSENCHSQTIAVVKTRCAPLGMTVHVCPEAEFDVSVPNTVAVVVQYPNTNGRIEDYASLAAKTREA